MSRHHPTDDPAPESGDQPWLESDTLQSLLDMVRREEPISRQELSDRTGVSPATVTRGVRILIEKRLLKENDPIAGRMGRRPRALSLDPDYRRILTVNLDTHRTDIGLLDMAGTIQAVDQFSTCPENGPDEYVRRLGYEVDRFLARQKIEKTRLLGLGVALPGDLEEATGEIQVAVALDWPPYPLPRIIEQHFDIPTRAGNRVEIAGVAEHYFGQAKGAEHYWYLYVGQGMSGVEVRHGLPANGVNAGDIGHIPLVPDGPHCRCGRQGCWEAIISEPALLRSMETDPRLAGRPLADLFREAERGYGPAAEQVDELVKHIAMAACLTLKLNDPEMVFLAGSVIEAGGTQLVDAVQAAVDALVLHESQRNGRIFMGSTEEGTALRGAAALVYQGLFHPRSPTPGVPKGVC